MRLTKAMWAGLGALAMTACGMETEPVEARSLETSRKLLRAEYPVRGQYIVKLRDGSGVSTQAQQRTVEALAEELVGGERVLHVYTHAVRGFAARMSEEEALRLTLHPAVELVEEDGEVFANTTQFNAPWNLDRIDQRTLPLNGTYIYTSTGQGVHAYIIDTGILASHSEFGGRVASGYDAVTAGGSGSDCNGHGTHVAGIVGGVIYGVAKQVTLHPVRVLDCAGSGSLSRVIAGVDWVRANHIKPAVANMSLGSSYSSTLNNAVANAINAGVTFTVAAGSSSSDACNTSPASVSAAITVAASTITDSRASYSNVGSCVDIFAPGSSITSAWYTSGTNTLSGTSMASPHVAGCVARYLQLNPTASPSQVTSYLLGNATMGVLSNTGTGTPNRLLYCDPAL